MSRKYYKAIAAILCDEGERAESEYGTNSSALSAVESVAQRLADYFSEENTQFDRNRFLKACGITKMQEE